MTTIEVFNLDGVVIGTFEAEHEDAARQIAAGISFGTRSVSIDNKDCFTRHEAVMRLDFLFAIEVYA